MASEKISRRKALKTLAVAASGLGAAAFLPAKWLKPVVQSGVLPAHAAASSAHIIYGDPVIFTGLIDEVRGPYDGSLYWFYLAYDNGAPKKYKVGDVISWEITAGTVAEIGSSGTLVVYALWGPSGFRAGHLSISAGGSTYGDVTFKFTMPGNKIVNASFSPFGQVIMGTIL